MTNPAARFSEVCAIAESYGYCVRPRWLDGCGGGESETAGQRWIFVDDMLPVEEQIETVLRVLRKDPRYMDQRKAA